jgi:hypothetical protein
MLPMPGVCDTPQFIRELKVLLQTRATILDVLHRWVRRL